MASKLEKQRPGLAVRLLLSSKARKESSQELLFPLKKARIDPSKPLGEAGGCGGPLRLPETQTGALLARSPPPPLSPRGRSGQRGGPPPAKGSAAGPRAPSPRPRGASRPESQRAAPPGESRPARPGPPPPPARALKDILLFLPRTKDNKRSWGATHRVRTPRPAPPGLQHPTPAPGRPPEPPARTGRAAGAPGSLGCRCRSGAFHVVGPAAPGASAARAPSPARGQPRPPGTGALLPRVCGPPGSSSSPAGGPRGRGETPDSSGCCCLSGHLVPCVCGVSLPSPLSALLPPPPPPAPYTTQHGLFAAAAAAAAAAGPPRSCPLPSPTLPASRPQPRVAVRMRATARPPRPLAPRASCHPLPGERPHARSQASSSRLTTTT
ncbi:basic salivary proline-rich protein 3-like [Odocoileus virginianus]|uniref:Basic salivary proline-rich protein 3-like n=1 Tax=Odocoileus virginianus TaxID=9874 RepID=A0ABM4J0N1_ODOVR